MNHTASRIAMIRKIIAERYPNTFAAKGQPKMPLAIGIGQDLALAIPEIGMRYVEKTLSDYTSGPTYLKFLVAGAARVNLKGEEDGVVTIEEAKHAAARLAGLAHQWSKDRPREPSAGKSEVEPA